jgi:hypothetical protein
VTDIQELTFIREKTQTKPKIRNNPKYISKQTVSNILHAKE